MTLNKQLEMQKERLEKIQEGIQLSKEAYSDTLRNLELISDDIHRVRQERKVAEVGPRGQGVGAESDEDDDESIPHDRTMRRLRAVTLDDMSDTLSNYDGVSSDSSAANSPSCMRKQHADEAFAKSEILCKQVSNSGDGIWADANCENEALERKVLKCDLNNACEPENGLTLAPVTAVFALTASSTFGQPEISVEDALPDLEQDPTEAFDVIPLEGTTAEPPTPDMLEPDFLEAISRRKTIPSAQLSDLIRPVFRSRSCERLEKLSQNERVRDSLHAFLHPECSENCVRTVVDGSSTCAVHSLKDAEVESSRPRKLSRSSNCLNLEAIENCPRYVRKRSSTHS